MTAQDQDGARPDECKCPATLLSSGLLGEWPECVKAGATVNVVEPVDPGECDAGDCEGPPAACSARVETNIDHTCTAFTMKQQKRAIGNQDWVELGVETLVPSGAWGFWVKPICGQERRAQILYGTSVVWEAIVRCGQCQEAGQ